MTVSIQTGEKGNRNVGTEKSAYQRRNTATEEWARAASLTLLTRQGLGPRLDTPWSGGRVPGGSMLSGKYFWMSWTTVAARRRIPLCER